jgi:hypothetical protein
MPALARSIVACAKVATQRLFASCVCHRCRLAGRRAKNSQRRFFAPSIIPRHFWQALQHLSGKRHPRFETISAAACESLLRPALGRKYTWIGETTPSRTTRRRVAGAWCHRTYTGPAAVDSDSGNACRWEFAPVLPQAQALSASFFPKRRPYRSIVLPGRHRWHDRTVLYRRSQLPSSSE